MTKEKLKAQVSIESHFDKLDEMEVDIQNPQTAKTSKWKETLMSHKTQAYKYVWNNAIELPWSEGKH